MGNFGNSVDWWVSTKASQHIFRPSHLTPEIEAYLRAAIGIDPAIISAEIKISVAHVLAAQRFLGLRTCSENNPRGTYRYALDHRGRSRQKPKDCHDAS